MMSNHIATIAQLKIKFLLILFFSNVLINTVSAATTSQSNPYKPAVQQLPNFTDFPRNYAYSMYLSTISRMAFGQAESVVEPLFYMAESDREFADLQNALAVSIFFTQAVRRNRAAEYAQQAITLEPDNNIFTIVSVLTNPDQSFMTKDGSVLLSKQGYLKIQIAEQMLSMGSPNNKMLAEILRTIHEDGSNNIYPYYFSGFERLRANPRLLITTPEKERFLTLEDKIRVRIETLAEEALFAKSNFESANQWLNSFKQEWENASQADKTEIERKSNEKQREFQKWLTISEQKASAVNIEFTKFEAFLKQDFITLAQLRVDFEKTQYAHNEPKSNDGVDNRDFTKPAASVAKNIPSSLLGKYFALVIGNNSYKYITTLDTAENDAQEIASLLKKKYNFTVELLLNTNRSSLLKSLYKLRGKLTDKDNLLIFYAGHGYFDEKADRGYWLPIDAQEDSPTNWISNSDITDQLKAIEAKHVLVVSDSCYSGTIMRDASIRPPDINYVQQILGRRARIAITSGGNEPVADNGPNGHSIFTNALLNSLKNNAGLLEATELFHQIRKRVISTAKSIQVPNYGIIRDAHHDGGDFLFVSQ